MWLECSDQRRNGRSLSAQFGSFGRNRGVDISKAERELGFKPTSLTAAVREAYEWFVSQNMIKTKRI